MKVIPFPGQNQLKLSRSEYNRLMMLQEKVNLSQHSSEVDVYAAEIKSIERGKLRASTRR
jgi:hypothetical protein